MSLFKVKGALIEVPQKTVFSPEVERRVLTVEESHEPLRAENGEAFLTEGVGG
jgi:hypothetical protein